MRKLQLTRKQVKLGLKKGYTVQDFCENYNCTADEFTDCIKRIFKNNSTPYRDIVSKLRSNEKQHRPTQRKKAEPQKAIKASNPKTESSEEVKASNPETEPSKEVETPSPAIISIEELLLREKELSELNMILEGEHKGYAQEYHKRRKAIREVNERAEELHRQATELKALFWSKLAEVNDCIHGMNDVHEQLHPLAEELEEVRQKIELAKTVTLSVNCESGEVLRDGQPVLADDRNRFFEIRNMLIDEKGYCNGLLPKPITSLALAIAIEEGFTAPVNFLFDAPEVAEAYKQYVADVSGASTV